MADMVANRSNGGYGVNSQDLLTGSGSEYADQERGPRVRVGSARGPSGFKTPSFKGLIKGFFFYFFSFFSFVFFLFFLKRERLSILSLGRFPAAVAPPRPSPIAAASDGRRARKWHWTIDRNPLVPDLDSSLPKSKQFFTNLQKSDSENNFFLAFDSGAVGFPLPGNCL